MILGGMNAWLARFCLLSFVVVVCAQSVPAQNEIYEIALWSGRVAPGPVSVTILVDKEYDQGNSIGINPGGNNWTPGSDYIFGAEVRLYFNGVRVGQTGIPFQLPGVQEMNVPVTVTATLPAAGILTVRFLSGFKVRRGGLPVGPEEAWAIRFAGLRDVPPTIPDPVPTPTPTPTPPVDPGNSPPRIRWILPQLGGEDVDVTLQVQTLTDYSLRGEGLDADSDLTAPASPTFWLSWVEVDGPVTQPAVTFLMPRQTVRTAVSPLGLETFRPPTRSLRFRYPGTYTYQAQAGDGAGAVSRRITLTLIATDGPPPDSSTRRINALLVSGANNPSDVIDATRSLPAEIRGGIIALGVTPLPGSGTRVAKLLPDPAFLSGEKIPPLVPWLFDIRETYYRIQAVETLPNGQTSARPIEEGRGPAAARAFSRPEQPAPRTVPTPTPAPKW